MAPKIKSQFISTLLMIPSVIIVAVLWLTNTQAADYSPFFKNDKVVSIAMKKAEDEKIDTATVTTKSGKCYMFQLQKGKVIAWKTCADTEWKSN